MLDSISERIPIMNFMKTPSHSVLLLILGRRHIWKSKQNRFLKWENYLPKKFFLLKNVTLPSWGFGGTSEIQLLMREDLCLENGLYVYVHVCLFLV